jgi:hypothetical protein
MILNLTNKILLTSVVSSLAMVVNAASFDLTVNDYQIDSSQTITLNFKLTDAKVTSHPDFSELSKYFDIYSQSTASAYSLTNGSLSQATTWSLVVLPKIVGKIIIPKISVATSKGVLASNEVEIEVATVNNSQPAARSSINNHVAKNKEIYFSGHCEVKEQYVNQPFVYTLKLYNKLALANTVLQNLHSNDAIIERHGEPLHYNIIHNGAQTNVNEIKYIVTPLKPGKITLNPASLKFEVLNSFFFPQSNGVSTIYSDEEVLNVLDVPGKLPPFSKLTIEDDWDITNKEIHENDSITRTIKIIGKDGYVGSLNIAIPEQNSQYNLYQDKNKESKSISEDNHVHSEKIINYTIIPIKAGELIIPKTTIKWWNVATKKVESLEIPEKIINVLSANSLNSPQQVPEETAIVEQKSVVDNRYKIGFILSLLFNLGFIMWHGLKYFIKSQKTKKPSLHLDDVKTVAELKNYINYFAQNTWKIKGNLPLKDLWRELNNNFMYDQSLAKELTSKLNSNLYFKEELQVAKAIDLWRKFSVTVAAKKEVAKDKELLPTKLNPT